MYGVKVYILSRGVFAKCQGVHVVIIIHFQALLKKHEALMSDLSAYGSSIQALREQAQSCRVRKDADRVPKIHGSAKGKNKAQ